jgi:tryptophanyl-tRNA synthetase
MRIFSGIQPTGRKHLGNYIGAIVPWVAGQERADSIFCAVDLHATTVPYDAAELRTSLYDFVAIVLAAGVDPERCVFFRQSDVAEHSELAWMLASVCAYGDLGRMHQFKDKTGSQRDLASAGLFIYPVLMAADVLGYRADEVPVGDDQRQHVELMRDIAQRFNQRYGEVLVVPEGRYPAVGARIMDLQSPERKMSTTGGSPRGTVYVTDEPEAILKKFRAAVTDSGSEVVHSPQKPGISNLIEILAAVRGSSVSAVQDEFAGVRYGDFKTAVGEAVVEYLAPVRERYGELRGDESALEESLAEGAERARALIRPVVADARAAMGLGPVAVRAG